MRDAAEAKAALQGMSDAVKAETAAEVAGSTQAAAARAKDLVAIQQETQAMSQLANAAKQTNVQLLYGGRNDETQHLSDMAQELNYTTLLNRQKWLGFSSVQQAMSYRQQMYQLALLENKAHFAGYLTADQYLGFLQREIAQTAALSAAIRDRSSAISAETQLLLAHTNALQGTHQTAGSLGEQLTSASAYSAAITGVTSLVTTRAVFDDSQALAEIAAYRATLLGLPNAESADIVSVSSRLGGIPLAPQRATVPVAVQPDIDYAAVNRMLSQALAGAQPEALREPLAITGSGSPASEALSAAASDWSDTSAAILQAYDALKQYDGEFVKLTDMYRQLDQMGIGRGEQMQVMGQMYREQAINLVPQSNQQALTDLQRETAIQMGGESKHLISVPVRYQVDEASTQAISAAAGDTGALAESMSLLSDKAAVTADAIAKFGDSATLAAVDARALTEGITRLAAAQQMLAEVQSKLAYQPRRKQIPQAERLGYTADEYALQEITGALGENEISNAPGGYPVAAPMQLTARPEEEEDLWAGLSRYMEGGKATEQVSVEGGQQAEQVLDKIAVQMEWLDGDTAHPKVDRDELEDALDDAYHLDGVLVGLTYERAEPEVDRGELEGAVTEAQLLANEMAHLNERSQAQLGVNFEQVEAARMAVEGLDEDLEEIPHEIDTVLVVDSSGAATEVRDYSQDIRDIEQEVGTRADFEDTEAESGLSRYLAALIEAVQRKYEFFASFNDDAGKAELAGWITELEEARAEENRITAGMGGAAGGGGGGSPPGTGGGFEDDEPDPEDAGIWEDIAKAMRDTDVAAIEANKSLYDVNAGLGGMADPAAKAAAALTTDAESFTSMGWRLNLLRKQITLWSGLFGTTEFIGQVALWHIALDGIIEILALWVPAIVTATAGLVGFGVAGYQTFKGIYQQWESLSTVGGALNTTIKPLTDNFQNLQNAVRPQIYELLGDYLSAASDKSSTFSTLIQETGNYLDKFAAKIVVDMQSGGKGLQDFFTAGIKDLALIGQGFDSLGVIFSKFIAATAITHIAEDLATVGDLILRVVADILQLVPTPVLAIALAIHGIILWGGLAADVVGKLVIGIAGLAGKLPALNTAAYTVAQTLGATNEQLVNIAKNSAAVGAVSDAMGAKVSEEELAQLSVSIQATGKSVEDFVTTAGTTSAARLSKFSEGLDESGQQAVALGIAAGASDTQLAGMAEKLSGAAAGAEDLGEGAAEAAEAVGGGGGLLASLGSLLPMLSNVYVDVGLLAAALLAVGVVLGTKADQTKQFTDAMGAAVAQASMLTVVSTTVSNLAEVTDTLNKAQATGIGNASELAASQADLSGKLGEELTHVGDVSTAYGVNFVGALNLLQAAGVSTTQLFTNQNNTWAVAMQMVKGLISGYQAMGQQLGAVGEDLNALNLENSTQVSDMNKLNDAWDSFTKTVGAAPTAFITMAQGFATFDSDAAAAGATMTGLSAASLTLQNDFQTNYNNVESFFDAFRNDQALTGEGNFTQFVKDAVASLIPMAGGSKEAAAQISALAQEAGGPATTNISTLQKWVGNIKDPLLAMYNASNQAAIGASNLSQDAAKLTDTLQSLLDPAMANAIFNAHGGQQVFNDFADSLAKSGPGSAATVAAAKNVATELLAVSGSSANAKSEFVGFAEASGLSAKQADALWAQATAHITANLSQVRNELAKNASQQANLVKPGEVDTMLKSFKDGTFYELTFLSWIPQVQRGLNVMNHDIGQFFAHDIPVAFDTTSHAFTVAWSGMVNWFSQSVPHGLEDAWDSTSSFFQTAFTKTIPGWWDDAWSNTVSPVAHAFNDVTSWVSSNFDPWWAKHGQGLMAIWDTLWGEVSGAAIKAFDLVKGGATGLWNVLAAIFTSSAAKEFWAGFSGAAKDTWSLISSEASAAWALVVSGARGAWSNVAALGKAAWDLVAAAAKATWDIIWALIGSEVKSAADIAVASFAVLWDQTVALAKIAWDTIVLVINEVIDLFTGHWQTAWSDLQAYGLQVWNAVKTGGIQTWNAISTAATQVWNALWGALKTAGTQTWNAFKTGAQQAWTAIWHSLQTTVINPLGNFFTGTVPKWWDDFANFASQTWSKVWTGFQKDVLTPVENWFTSTLPNAMWNSLKGGIDHVITGLNTVIGWINAVTSVVGVHISPISMLAAGGGVRMASGSVPGTGDEDGTHVIAMGGEYMLRKPARMALQAAYGPDFLDALNNADTWLGSGSRGNAASQRAPANGRYASGGGILGDIGDWIGDAASAVSGAASAAWTGISDAAKDVAKFGESAVFNAMWTTAGVPAEKALEALGGPGDMGAAWLQDIHNGVSSWISSQTTKAQASGSISTSGVSNSSAEAALKSAAAEKGWTGAEWTALFDVEEREAGFNLNATNPSSGAYGMAQFINGAGEYAEYGGNSSTAAGQAVAMVNYIAQRYGTPEAAWAHELAYGWYAGGGPVITAIQAATANKEIQEAMALGSWLLTRLNAAGSAPTLDEYGAFLVNLGKHKGFTQADAQNATQAVALVEPAYAKGVLGSTTSDWKNNPAAAALAAYSSASASLGTHWSTPASDLLAQGWSAVQSYLAPAAGTTTAQVSSSETAAYQAAAAKLYPDWEGALGPWHTLSALGEPKGTSAANWKTWLAQRAVVQNRVTTASDYIGPLFDDLKTNPQELTAADWSLADSSVRRWQAAMDVATWAKSNENSYYSPIQNNLTNLQAEIIDAANAWHEVWGVTSTPTPATGTSGSGGTSTASGTSGPGSGGAGGVQPTVIDLAPLIIGGPKVANAGGYGFNIAAGGNVGGNVSLGSVAGMFGGGMASGGILPTLNVPGLSASMAKQLSAATSGQLPRTLSDAAGSRVGLQVDQLTINNPVSEKPSDSIARASNRLAFLGGRGMV